MNGWMAFPMTVSLFEFWQYRISMLFMLAYVLVLLPLRWRKSVSVLVALGCFVVTGALDAYTFLVKAALAPTLAMTLVQAALVQLTVLLLCKYRDMRAIFTGVSAATYVLAGNLASTTIHLLYGRALPSLLAEIVVHTMILGFFVRYVRENFVLEIHATPKHWGAFTLLPLLVYSAVYGVISWPSNIYETPTNAVAAAVIVLLMTVAYLMLFDLLAQRRVDDELGRQNEFLDACAHSMRHEITAMQRTEDELATTRHDMRHVYRLLDGYLATGEIDKARALLHERDAALEATRLTRLCRNPTLNTVLSGSAAMAGQAGVTFTCQAAVPERLKSVNEFELAIVLSNLLENAILAVQKEPDPQNRWVKVRIFSVKEQLVMEIANYSAASQTLSPTTGLPLSAKGEGHGYGLRSVQAFATKNNAVFNISTTPPQFRVRLMVRE